MKKCCCRGLPPGSVIVLDSARFHQSQTTLRLVEAAGCQLFFFPAYSPDLNPVEHLWAAFKTRCCKNLSHRRQPLPFYRQHLPMILLYGYSKRPLRDGHNKTAPMV